MTRLSNFSVELASLEDVQGIYNTFKQNLFEIKNIDDLSKKEIKELEEKGFLRKEVDIEYYNNLIRDPTTDIFIAKSNSRIIIGFATIFRKKNNILKIRDVINSFSFKNEKARDLLLDEKRDFAYLDQISVLPEYKRKGVGSAIFQKILLNVDTPIVVFIVVKPLFNKASALWHKNNGFELSALSSGKFNEKQMEFQIFIHWNKK